MALFLSSHFVGIFMRTDTSLADWHDVTLPAFFNRHAETYQALMTIILTRNDLPNDFLMFITGKCLCCMEHGFGAQDGNPNVFKILSLKFEATFRRE